MRFPQCLTSCMKPWLEVRQNASKRCPISDWQHTKQAINLPVANSSAGSQSQTRNESYLRQMMFNCRSLQTWMHPTACVPVSTAGTQGSRSQCESVFQEMKYTPGLDLDCAWRSQMHPSDEFLATSRKSENSYTTANKID